MVAPHARTTPAQDSSPEGVELDPLRNPERRRRAAAASARDIALGGDPDALWLIAAHEATAGLLAAGSAHGPIPRARTDEWCDAPPEVRVASLLLCGVAYVLNGDPHRLALQLMKETSLAVYGADPAFWQAASSRHLEVARSREAQRNDRTARLSFRCDVCSTPVPIADARPIGQAVACSRHREAQRDDVA